MITSTIRITLFSLVLILLTGVAYPFAVTSIAQTLLPHQANGSLIEKDGRVIGSRLIAQKFEGVQYFYPRPSAAGGGYEANNSGASNLSMTNKALNETYKERIAALPDQGEIPVDLITASGSGLDPHITPEAGLFQAGRVASARNIEVSQVQGLITKHTEGRTLGILGAPRVNVLALNLALDTLQK